MPREPRNWKLMADINTPLNTYLQGHATGQAALMRDAFLPSARIEGIREGKLISWTVEEYCRLFQGSPAPDEASRRRTIDAIETAGSAACARLTLVHGATIFSDLML